LEERKKRLSFFREEKKKTAKIVFKKEINGPGGKRQGAVAVGEKKKNALKIGRVEV